jgi:hypothetical protein
MRYMLRWKPLAEARLAEIWTESTNRQAVTEAAKAIDQALRTRPLDEGESRDALTRILVEEPLVVVYEVRDEDRLVEVLEIRAWPDRG